MKFIMALTLMFCFSMSTEVVLANNDLAQTDCVEMIDGFGVDSPILTFANVDVDASALTFLDLSPDLLFVGILLAEINDHFHFVVVATNQTTNEINESENYNRNRKVTDAFNLFLNPRDKLSQI